MEVRERKASAQTMETSKSQLRPTRAGNRATHRSWSWEPLFREPGGTPSCNEPFAHRWVECKAHITGINSMPTW